MQNGTYGDVRAELFFIYLIIYYFTPTRLTIYAFYGKIHI